jgi:hypothetical protein
VEIEDTNARSSGGGLYIQTSSGGSAISGLRIKTATAGGNGGGAYISSSGPLSLDHLTFENTGSSTNTSNASVLYIANASEASIASSYFDPPSGQSSSNGYYIASLTKLTVRDTDFNLSSGLRWGAVKASQGFLLDNVRISYTPPLPPLQMPPSPVLSISGASTYGVKSTCRYNGIPIDGGVLSTLNGSPALVVRSDGAVLTSAP